MNKIDIVFQHLVEFKNRMTEDQLAVEAGTTGSTVRSYISRLRRDGYAIAKRARMNYYTHSMLPAEYFHVSHTEETPSKLVSRRVRPGRTRKDFADPVVQ